MHADVVGGNTEPEEKFGAELYVGTLCMHAIERGAEENRSVCVCVCVREREVAQWLMHNDNKKGHNIITTYLT